MTTDVSQPLAALQQGAIVWACVTLGGFALLNVGIHLTNKAEASAKGTKASYAFGIAGVACVLAAFALLHH